MHISFGEKLKTDYIIIIAVFLAIHILLLFHDVNHPESLLSGDRSQSRMEVIEYVFFEDEAVLAPSRMLAGSSKADSLLANLVRVGDPGDYIYHGSIYRIGGPYLIIVFQLFLALLATIVLYKLIVLLEQPSGIALMTSLIFIFLPGNLMHSHQLVTEALYNPAIIFALYLLVFCTQNRLRKDFAYFAFILLALAISIRLQLVLYPVILATIFLFHFRQNGWKFGIPVLLICYMPLVSWMFLNYFYTGAVGLGPRDNNLTSEFFEVALRMANAGVPFEPSNYPNREIPLSEFLVFVRNAPVTYLGIELSDFFNTYFNPGVNHFGAHYLGLFDAQDNLSYWKDLRDREGIIGVLVGIARSGSGFATVFFSVTLLWGVVLLISAFGAILFIRADNITAASKSILLSYIVYSTLVLHAASNSRWTYRTHFEFVLMVFFAMALTWIVQRYFRRHGNEARQAMGGTGRGGEAARSFHGDG